MSTSGSYDFTLSRNNIVKRAYNFIGIYNAADTIESQDQDIALDLLNMMIKSWQAETRSQWNRQTATLFTAYQSNQYNLSLTGDHCTKSYKSTTITPAEASGQTVISLASTTGMTAGDYIGIQLDGGTRQWTTIVTVDSSVQVTITAALTGAAASGNTVVTYTTKINRPLEIFTANWKRLSADTETPMEQVLYEEYQYIPDKVTDGAPNCYMYDAQLTTGKLYLWPRPNDVDYIINFSYQESTEDFDAQANNADFPQEWELALVVNLSALLAFPNGRFPEMDKIQMQADKLKMLALNYDNNNTSIILTPKNRASSRVIV